MSRPTRERDLLEAYFHGGAVMLCVIAATLALVIGLILALGGATPWEAIGGVVVLLLTAGGFALYSRLARSP